MANFKGNNISEYHIVKLEVVFADSKTSTVDVDVLLVSDGGLVIGPVPLKNLKTPDVDERVGELLAACYSNLGEAFGLNSPLPTEKANTNNQSPPPGFGDEDFNI